jgi:uncharacterized protein (DUF2267 family)
MAAFAPEPFVLGARYGWSSEQVEAFRMKASALRGMLDAIADRPDAAAIRAELPGPIAALFDDPPPAVRKIAAVQLQYLLEAVERVAGPDGLRETAQASVIRGPLKTMRPFIEGVLRLFGQSPKGLLLRVPQVMAQQLEGMSFTSEATDEFTCVIAIRNEVLPTMPRRTWTYWEGVLATTYALCGTRGSVRARVVHDLAPAAELVCCWRPDAAPPGD